MKILITGITGFIGKNLLKAIAGDGNQYVCLIRKMSNLECFLNTDNVVYRVSDFTSKELADSMQGFDVVIHMAGQMGAYGVTWETYKKGNVTLTKSIIEACNAAEIKQLIYISTPGVIGFGKRLSGEEEPYSPRNAYEKTKVIAEKNVIEGLKKTKYTILRPDFVYGPEDIRRIKMYKNIRDHKFVLTTSGKSYLSPTYVMDVVQGIVKSIGRSVAYNEIFNISGEIDITVREYLDTIANYFKVKVVRINIGYHLSVLLANMIERFYNNIMKREGFVSKNKIDFLSIDHSTSCEKARRLIEYQPEYSFAKGFAETMNWCIEKQLL